MALLGAASARKKIIQPVPVEVAVTAVRMRTDVFSARANYRRS
jgi:hypothetical protein